MIQERKRKEAEAKKAAEALRAAEAARAVAEAKAAKVIDSQFCANSEPIATQS